MHAAAVGALADWEMTRSGRAVRTYGLRIAALLFAAIPILMAWNATRNSALSAANQIDLLSAYLSSTISIFQVFVVVIAAPLLASMAFADERQGGTLDLLIMTGTRWPSIVATKFISIYTQVVLMLLAILPFAAIGSLFGGIDVVALAGRTVAVAALAYVVCGSGILASVWPRQGEMALFWTAGYLCLYVLIAYIPDAVTNHMAGTNAGQLLGARAFTPNLGGSPWPSLAMAVAVGTGYLVVALRLTPLGNPVAANRDLGRRRKTAPETPRDAVAALISLLGVQSALPWTRSRRRLALFIVFLLVVGAMLPGISFFLYALAAYSAAAVIHRLRRDGLLEKLRLVTTDRDLTRLLIQNQVRTGACFLVLPLSAIVVSIMNGAGIADWGFHIANGLMMAGFVVVLIAIASLLSTYRGGVALHAVVAFGLSYLALIGVVIFNQSWMFAVPGGIWMGLQEVVVAAVVFFLFTRRFPHSLPA